VGIRMQKPQKQSERGDLDSNEDAKRQVHALDVEERDQQ